MKLLVALILISNILFAKINARNSDYWKVFPDVYVGFFFV